MKKFFLVPFFSTLVAYSADSPEAHDNRLNIAVYLRHQDAHRPIFVHSILTTQGTRLKDVGFEINNTYACEGNLIFNSKRPGLHAKRINVTESFSKLSDFDPQDYALTFYAIPVTKKLQQSSMNIQAHARI